MPDVVITADKVCTVLQDLNCDSAMGPDYVQPQVLNACASQIAVPLSTIFNMTLVVGLLPDVWLQSVIIPLFKAKSRYDPGNYRPIDLTYVCCKAMERVLASELILYLETNGSYQKDSSVFIKLGQQKIVVGVL